MVLPSECRDYQVSSGVLCLSTSRQTAKNANGLEQDWALGSLWRDSFVARLNAQEGARLFLVRLVRPIDNELLIWLRLSYIWILFLIPYL